MTPICRSPRIGVGLLGALAIAGAAWSAEGYQLRQRPPETRAAEKAGWWVRIHPDNEATHVYWRFGAERNRLSAPVIWAQGTSPEALDAPEEQRSAEELHIAVIGLPPNKKVSFCVFYGDKGVEHVDFTQETTLDVEQDDDDDDCVP